MGENLSVAQKGGGELLNLGELKAAPGTAVVLLTGGGDRPYVFGLATALTPKGAAVDLIGSDELDSPDFRSMSGVSFRNLRGNTRPEASFVNKIFRVLTYYARLIGYAALAEPVIFHILWNNRFEIFDRTLLMLYYKVLGKRIVLTVHNVNAGRRDAKDSSFNRLTLGIQYRLANHIFVHTPKMKRELIEEFCTQACRVTVIPFGLNNAVPTTCITPGAAKRRLDIREGCRTILFFGRITPYKGLEYLIAAFQQVCKLREDYRLIIAGRPERCEKYWTAIEETIREYVQRGQILLKAEFIPDEETEVYFKAADVLVLPYKDVFQSGVLFLGQSFGLPALVADVGSLKDDIVEGETGFVFRPQDSTDIARAIERYFSSDLFANLTHERARIRYRAAEEHSWNIVADKTMSVYRNLLESCPKSIKTRRQQ